MNKVTFTKKMMFLLSSFLLFFTLSVGTGWTIPFPHCGTVNPNYNNSWDPGSATGTALFELSLLPDPAWSDLKVYGVDLTIEGDIFDLNQVDVSDFTILNPSSGWNLEVTPERGGYKFTIAGDPTKTTVITQNNGPVQISFDYVMLSSDRFYNTSGSGWSWDKAVWAVSYNMHAIDSNGTEYHDGGCASPVPEPATIMLVGAGLMGFGRIARKKMK